jgi:hypothetical protein
MMQGRCEDGVCTFFISYSEGSLVSGNVIRDVVDFGGDIGERVVTFGCATREVGQINAQEEDGLFGFSRGGMSLRAQLVQQGVVEDAFGLCVERIGSYGGVLRIGKYESSEYEAFLLDDSSKMQAAKLLHDPTFYYLNTTSWTLDGAVVPFSHNLFTLLDSGTTFTTVPTKMYKAFVQHLDTITTAARLSRVDGPDPEYDDVCYRREGLTVDGLEDVFPPLSMSFAPDVHLHANVDDYLFAHEHDDSAFCVGVFDSGGTNRIILGLLTMRNLLLEYDVGNGVVNFARANCTAFRENFVEGGHNTLWPPGSTPPNSSNDSNIRHKIPRSDGSAGHNIGLILFMLASVVGVGFVAARRRSIAAYCGACWLFRERVNPWHRMENEWGGEVVDAEIEMIGIVSK